MRKCSMSFRLFLAISALSLPLSAAEVVTNIKLPTSVKNEINRGYARANMLETAKRELELMSEAASCNSLQIGDAVKLPICQVGCAPISWIEVWQHEAGAYSLGYPNGNNEGKDFLSWGNNNWVHFSGDLSEGMFCSEPNAAHVSSRNYIEVGVDSRLRLDRSSAPSNAIVQLNLLPTGVGKKVRVEGTLELSAMPDINAGLLALDIMERRGSDFVLLNTFTAHISSSYDGISRWSVVAEVDAGSDVRLFLRPSDKAKRLIDHDLLGRIFVHGAELKVIE